MCGGRDGWREGGRDVWRERWVEGGRKRCVEGEMGGRRDVGGSAGVSE